MDIGTWYKIIVDIVDFKYYILSCYRFSIRVHDRTDVTIQAIGKNLQQCSNLHGAILFC